MSTSEHPSDSLELSFQEPSLVAETAHLRLRCFSEDDTDRLVAIFSDPEIMRFSLGGPRDRSWCRERLDAILESYEKNGFGLWAVMVKSTSDADSYIGYCGLKRWSDLGGRAEVELGYRSLPSSWGNGYGTEAAMAARDVGFDRFRLRRLVSVIEPDNIGSWRIAEKIGMHLEGDLALDGKPVRVYAIER